MARLDDLKVNVKVSLLTDTSYREFLPRVSAADLPALLEKDRSYKASWKRRGGIGAFMMLARKWDRLEAQVEARGYDVFQAIEEDTAAGLGEAAVIESIRDLRRYLLLVEAEMAARGVTLVPSARELDEEMWPQVTMGELYGEASRRVNAAGEEFMNREEENARIHAVAGEVGMEWKAAWNRGENWGPDGRYPGRRDVVLDAGFVRDEIMDQLRKELEDAAREQDPLYNLLRWLGDRQLALSEGMVADAAQEISVLRGERDHLRDQIKQLADFIVAAVPGEPSQSEGAVGTAIRIIRNLQGPAKADLWDSDQGQDPKPDKRTLGLFDKYLVERRDGSSAPGGKHEHCVYFVLDRVHDKFAPAALLAYADACAAEYPKLAEDLRTEVAARLALARYDGDGRCPCYAELPGGVVTNQRCVLARDHEGAHAYVGGTTPMTIGSTHTGAEVVVHVPRCQAIEHENGGTWYCIRPEGHAGEHEWRRAGSGASRHSPGAPTVEAYATARCGKTAAGGALVCARDAGHLGMHQTDQGAFFPETDPLEGLPPLDKP